jgi:GcrA cell cycle regulator
MWTDERVAELKRLWGHGWSAGMIARELRGVTRNAVIGKLSRLGLCGAAKDRGANRPPATKQTLPLGGARARKPSTLMAKLGYAGVATSLRSLRELGCDRALPTRQAQSVVRSPAASPAPSPDDLALPAVLVAPLEGHPHRCTLFELSDSKCRWPLGDPRAADFFFCGGERVPGLPYCSGHARLAYNGAPPLNVYGVAAE